MDVQNKKNRDVVNFLRHSGLETDHIKAFLYLCEHGPQTVVSLSRGISSGRTRLYPILEDLNSKGLISSTDRHYGTTYQARRPENTEFLVLEKEKDSNMLRNEFPAALDALKDIYHASPNSTQIIEYSGLDGIKQMHWNMTKTKNVCRALEMPVIQKAVGKNFQAKVRDKLNDHSIQSYTLTNHKIRSRRQSLESPVETRRFIAADVFPITSQTYIYDNVYALISFSINSVEKFKGVEIYSETLARQQIQLFDFFWQKADQSDEAII